MGSSISHLSNTIRLNIQQTKLKMYKKNKRCNQIAIKCMTKCNVIWHVTPITWSFVKQKNDEQNGLLITDHQIHNQLCDICDNI